MSSFSDSFFYLVLLSFVTQQPTVKNLIPLVSISETLPFFLSVFIGTIADITYKKRKYLIASILVRIFLYLVITLFYFRTNVFAFVVSACLLNIFSDVFGKYSGSLQIPVIKFLISDDVTMERVQGINSAFGQISSIAGTLVGGFLFTRVKLEILLSLNILLFGFVLLLTIIIIYQCNKIYKIIEAEKAEIVFHFLTELKTTIQLVFQIKGLRQKLLFVSIANGLLSLTLPVISLIASGQHISEQLSIIQTLQICFMILGSILAGIGLKKIKLIHLFILFFIFYSFFLVGLLFNKILLSMIFVSLFSLCLGMITPKFMAYVISIVSVKNIGGFIGAINTLIMFIPFMNTVLLQILLPLMDVEKIVRGYIMVTTVSLGFSILFRFLDKNNYDM
ncbi:MFS transporter [Enterococcus casseliflavus]|uniref:MFS transporter n=1 Tax=Enterococcus casseliflavus TaxID=37734 RepID=UPI0023783F28|nr:MFS transporter [Enterococcus casseliflavus]